MQILFFRPIGKIIWDINLEVTASSYILLPKSIHHFPRFQKLLLRIEYRFREQGLQAPLTNAYRWIPVSSRGRQRKPTARFAVTENRTRQLHARDIKDYNGRPLITGLEAWPFRGNPCSTVVGHSSWRIPLSYTWEPNSSERRGRWKSLSFASAGNTVSPVTHDRGSGNNRFPAHCQRSPAIIPLSSPSN